jgi:deoxycytidylate deaminase
MNKKQEKILDTLFDLAVDHEDNPHRAKLSACLMIRDAPIAWGFNSMKSHPFQAQYSRNEESVYWHAENRTLHNALKRYSKSEIAGSTMLIVRAKKNRPGPKGEWVCGLAHPCEGCMKSIAEYQIKKVIYTTDTPNYLGVIDLVNISEGRKGYD